MGVIYAEGDDVNAHLVPFLQAGGLIYDRAAVDAVYLPCSLGRFDTDELWRRLGATDPTGLDDAYLRSHRLTDGVADFVAAQRNAGRTVAALTNDVSAWSRALRRRSVLDVSIDPWVVSGDIGVRKPDPAAFDALVEALPMPRCNIVFVDDRAANLDAAVAAGLQTV